MPVSKIAITIDNNLLKEIDLLVKSNLLPNRSKAIQEAIADKLKRLKKTRLAQECARLDPVLSKIWQKRVFQWRLISGQNIEGRHLLG